MRFREARGGWRERRPTQEEAAQLLYGISPSFGIPGAEPLSIPSYFHKTANILL